MERGAHASAAKPERPRFCSSARACQRLSVPSRPCVSSASGAPGTAPTPSTPAEAECALRVGRAQAHASAHT